jgi:acetyl-CoA acetyltransferase
VARNPIKDQVAIVGVGSTGFSRTNDRSALALALDASTKAIRDAGLTAADINGVVTIGEPGAPSPQVLASSLGITDVTHFSRPAPVAMFSIIDAMNAVFSGSCDAALVCASMLRLPWASRSAAKDPFRRSLVAGGGGGGARRGWPENVTQAAAYAAWASRYIHDYNATREPFGRIAINCRTNAVDNPLAAMRTPITMDDYLAARMIREPLCMLDMDVPVDGADAFVLTTADRARSLAQPPVLIHAATVGLIDRSDEDQLPGLSRHGQHVVVEALRAKSDLWLDDVDVYYPYDGFTIITLGWLENTGWCGPGEATRFIADNWDDDAGRMMIDGRIPVNSHGGSLSEGGTRGTGHVREAVMQLRGQADSRQVAGAKTALVTSGGFFFNSQGVILRAA